MSTNITTQLEQAAVQAFHRGDRWHQFVATYRTAIKRAEQAHPGTVARLLCIVTSGTTSGMLPVDVDDAWGTDRGQLDLFENSEAYR